MMNDLSEIAGSSAEFRLWRDVRADGQVHRSARIAWTHGQQMAERIYDHSWLLNHQPPPERRWAVDPEDPRRAAVEDFITPLEASFEVLAARLLATAWRLDPVIFADGASLEAHFQIWFGAEHIRNSEQAVMTLRQGVAVSDFVRSWALMAGGNPGAGVHPNHDGPEWVILQQGIDASISSDVWAFMAEFDAAFTELRESFGV